MVLVKQKGVINSFATFFNWNNLVPYIKNKRLKHVVFKEKEYTQIAYIRTGNSAFISQDIIELGGFNPDFLKPGGEDPDLCFRLLAKNKRLKIIKKLIVFHYHYYNLVTLTKTFVNYGTGDYYLGKNAKNIKNIAIKNVYQNVLIRKFLGLLREILKTPLTIIRGVLKKKSIFEIICFPVLFIYIRVVGIATVINLKIQNK